MTFLPAESEGGQNIYLCFFFRIFLGLPVGICLALVVAGICLDFIGQCFCMFLTCLWDFFFFFFGGGRIFLAFFCQVEFLNFPMLCPYVLFSHLLPHLHCIFNPFPLMPYGHMAIYV